MTNSLRILKEISYWCRFWNKNQHISRNNQNWLFPHSGKFYLLLIYPSSNFRWIPTKLKNPSPHNAQLRFWTHLSGCHEAQTPCTVHRNLPATYFTSKNRWVKVKEEVLRFTFVKKNTCTFDYCRFWIILSEFSVLCLRKRPYRPLCGLYLKPT